MEPKPNSLKSQILDWKTCIDGEGKWQDWSESTLGRYPISAWPHTRVDHRFPPETLLRSKWAGPNGACAQCVMAELKANEFVDKDYAAENAVNKHLWRLMCSENVAPSKRTFLGIHWWVDWLTLLLLNPFKTSRFSDFHENKYKALWPLLLAATSASLEAATPGVTTSRIKKRLGKIGANGKLLTCQWTQFCGRASW